MAKKSKKYIDLNIEDFIKKHPDAIFTVSGQTSGSSGFHGGRMDAESLINMAKNMPIVSGWGEYAVVSHMFYDGEDSDAYENMDYWEWNKWRQKKYIDKK